MYTLQLRILDPFLMLDEFKVRKPAGFPDHPHRGFETVRNSNKGHFSIDSIYCRLLTCWRDRLNMKTSVVTKVQSIQEIYRYSVHVLLNTVSIIS